MFAEQIFMQEIFHYAKLPTDFNERMKKLLGSEYYSFLSEYNNPPVRGLRVNVLRCEPTAFAAMSHFNLRRTPFAPEGFVVSGKVSGRHPYHHAGLFYFQEPSAMSVVTALDVHPGMRVLDLCAAPGGKSTQAGAQLHGEGLIVCNEIISSPRLGTTFKY